MKGVLWELHVNSTKNASTNKKKLDLDLAKFNRIFRGEGGGRASVRDDGGRASVREEEISPNPYKTLRKLTFGGGARVREALLGNLGGPWGGILARFIYSPLYILSQGKIIKQLN